MCELVLCRFVAFLVHQGLSYTSVRQYLCAIRHRQIIDGGVDPCMSSFQRLHYVLRGCHRTLGSQVRERRLPITPAILQHLHSYWSPSASSFDTKCLWAACCTGFFAFLRSGEFTCDSWSSYTGSTLSLSDVAIDDRTNPTMVHLTLRHSKTDIFGAGVTIHMGRTGQLLCPVSALLAYLAVRPPTPGPLFLLQSGAPLSKNGLVTAVRAALPSGGVDVSRYNGHSFRIGAATAANQAGISDATIQLLGRWKSSAFTRYLYPPVQVVASFSRRLLEF